MPKSRNRQNKAITRQVWKQLRDIKTALRNFLLTFHQHAAVINAQREYAARLELRIQLLEEKVYANLTPEERERLADILDPPQPETQQPVAQDAPALPEAIEGEVIDAEIVDETLPAPVAEGEDTSLEQKPAA